jgi:uracil-DNA glycosylase family 4
MFKVPRPSPGPIVPAYGPVPSHLYVLGERAGKKEHVLGVPFVGGAGKALRKWFDLAKLDLDNFRRWNVCIDYKPDNPKPLGREIERDRMAVETDIVRCQPNVIVAVGVHAMRWCLKTRSNLDKVHGDPVDVQIGDHKAVCVPIYHPSTYGRIERAEMGRADVLTVARVLRREQLKAAKLADSKIDSKEF